MELKPGYKMTEVGVIPEDWEVKPISQVAPLQRGFDLPNSEIKPGPFPVVYSNGIENFHNVAMIKGPGIVTGRSGTLGKVHYVESNYWPHNTSLWVTQFNNNDPKFIYYLYQSLRFERFASGSGVPTLNRNDAHSYEVAIPPTQAEQRAIAQALSDVDALLAALDRLIAKKQAIKQATMQSLLTGKKRLPGFSGDWVVKALGELGEITGAGVDKKIYSNELSVRLLNYMDVYQKDFLKADDFWHEVTAKPDQVKRCSVQRGDVFFTPTSEVRDDIGYSAVAIEDAPNVVYSYHVVRLRLSEVWNIDFRAYAFKTKHFLDQASIQCEGSGTRYVITLPKFRTMTVQYPAEVAEQTAIAAVLSDMDAELSALKTRRDKTRQLKHAMMQELLTGKTRLI